MYEQRPPVGRHYSQPYAGYGESSKRPRTASEGQVPLYNQQPQGLEGTQFTERPYPGQNAAFPNTYLQQPSPQGSYYNNFAAPNQVSNTAARDQYFAQRLNTIPTGNNNAYDPNSARSPQSPFFPPQPQTVRYQQSPQQGYNMAMLSPTGAQRVETTQSAFESLGLTASGQPSPELRGPDMSGMTQPTYGRMNTGGYGTVPVSSADRRDSYQYQQVTQNMSVGNLMYSSGPTMQTSAVSGPLDHTY